MKYNIRTKITRQYTELEYFYTLQLIYRFGIIITSLEHNTFSTAKDHLLNILTFRLPA